MIHLVPSHPFSFKHLTVMKGKFTILFMGHNNILTIWLAEGTNIPKVNNPNSGPPTTPKIVRLAWRTPPRCCAAKAIPRHRNPYNNANTFEMSPLQVSGSGVFLSLAYAGWGGTSNTSNKFRTRRWYLETYLLGSLHRWSTSYMTIWHLIISTAHYESSHRM